MEEADLEDMRWLDKLLEVNAINFKDQDERRG